MSGPIQVSRMLSMRPRQPRLRSHSSAEEPGLCALDDYSYLAGESVVMRSLRAQLRRAAPHFRVALITGEAGTGKEVVALALHRLSDESDATFFSQSTAAFLALMPDLLARMETDDECAVHGAPRTTNFLPEAGDLTFGEQLYLRRSLRHIYETKSHEHQHTEHRDGMDRPRMIFGTGRDLRSLSGAGHFDRGLYRAISAVEIVLPPLRARTEDIPLITCGLLRRSPHGDGTPSSAFDGRALARLQAYEWPGNVSELEQVVNQARQQAGDGVIEADHLPTLGEFARNDPRHQARGLVDAHVDRLDDVIQGHVLDVLLRCAGNKVRAAERLGISRSTLYRMLDAGSVERAS